MNREPRISGVQLAVLLLTGRLSGALLLTPDSLAELNLTDSLWTALVSGVLVFVCLLPTLWVCRCTGGGLTDCALSSRLVGKTVCSGYALLCLFVLCLDMVQFCDFADKVMHRAFPVPVLACALLAVAFAASFYGIQALARAALPVAVFSVACLLLFGVSLLPQLRLWHFPPIESQGIAAVFLRAVRELPRSAEVVAVGMLYSSARSRQTGACAAFAGGTALATAGVITTAVGVLGDFAGRTAYPYYTAISAVSFGVFERMDILITAVWLGTFFVRLTLFCGLYTDAVRRVCGQRSRIPAALLGAVVLCTFVVLLPQLPNSWVAVTAVYWWTLGIFAVALPLGLAVWRKRRRGT